MSGWSLSASITGSSVVPGLPNRWLTPSSFKRARNADRPVMRFAICGLSGGPWLRASRCLGFTHERRPRRKCRSTPDWRRGQRHHMRELRYSSLKAAVLAGLCAAGPSATRPRRTAGRKSAANRWAGRPCAGAAGCADTVPHRHCHRRASCIPRAMRIAVAR